MPLKVHCERCGKNYRVRDELAGRRVRCKICKSILSVPQTGDESGQIIRHESRKREFEFAIGDEVNIERIDAHIQKHIGPVEMVYHEMISDLVHIDVHLVEASRQNPCQTLVTSGMSDRPMTVPEGAEEFRHGELFLSLPPDWPLTDGSLDDERHAWPVHWLKMLARFPHEYETWFGHGHSIPNGDPPTPLADDTRFCGFILAQPFHAPQEFHELSLEDGGTIWMWALYPLYREEIDYKLKHGADALLERLHDAGVTEIIDIGRRNVCRKRFGFF